MEVYCGGKKIFGMRLAFLTNFNNILMRKILSRVATVTVLLLFVFFKIIKKDDEKKLGWERGGGKGSVGEVRGKEVRKRCFSAGLRLGVDFVKKNRNF